MRAVALLPSLIVAFELRSMALQVTPMKRSTAQTEETVKSRRNQTLKVVVLTAGLRLIASNSLYRRLRCCAQAQHKRTQGRTSVCTAAAEQTREQSAKGTWGMSHL